MLNRMNHDSPVPVNVNVHDAEAVCAHLDEATACLKNAPLRRGCAVHLPAQGNLLATGDLHDNPLHLAKILHLAQLGQSPHHHLILHELIHGERLINGMDFSHRMIIKTAGLVLQFPNQVHPLLANHELSQLTGKGVSKGAGNSVELFNDAVEFSYGEDAPAVTEALNGFFRALPLAVISESGICCAHSLPNARMMRRFDPQILSRKLETEDYLSPTGNAYLMTWGRAYDDESTKTLADAWKVDLFILGHRHVETGCEAMEGCGDRVIVLNSDHERGMVLKFDLAEPLPHPLPPDWAAEKALYATPLSSVG